MATTPTVFFRGKAPVQEAVVYTAPSGTKAILTNVVATNPNAASSMVAVKIAGIHVLANVGIAANGVLTLELSQVLNPGDTIAVQGNTAAASVHISGVEVS